VRGLILMTVLALVAACGGGSVTTQAPRASATGTVPSPAPTTPSTTTPASAPATVSGGGLPSGESLCALLTSADWGQFNYVTAAQPEIESDSPGSAYCTYAGDSGASGGLEFDAFAHETVEDAEETFDLISGGTDGDGKTVTIPGADEVFIDSSIDDTFGAIVVRTGRFTYTVTVPDGDQAETQLLALAAIVLTRASALR
jgi:hypothetical protein